MIQQRYRPFGQPRLSTSGSPTDRGFTGQRELSQAGFADFNARWFDTSLGGFASPDSLIPDAFSPQSLNRYGYVLNNPLRYTVPTGRRACDDSDAAGRCVTAPPVPRTTTLVNVETATSTSLKQTEQRRNDVSVQRPGQPAPAAPPSVSSTWTQTSTPEPLYGTAMPTAVYCLLRPGDRQCDAWLSRMAASIPTRTTTPTPLSACVPSPTLVSGYWVARQACGLVDIQPGPFTGQPVSPRELLNFAARAAESYYGVPASWSPLVPLSCTAYDIVYDQATRGGDYFDNWPGNP